MKLVKKQIFVTVVLAIVFGFVAGLLSSSYLIGLNNKKAAINEINSATNLGTEKTIPEVVKEVSPAVVSIIVSKLVPILERGFYNPFGENSPFDIRIPILREKGKELQEVGGGTGFIVSRDGLIVTNKHVVFDEDAEYSVFTNDGKEYKAKVLARDPIQDVAILQISATNLSMVRLGDSDKLEIGQTVIAIGNALGEFRNTVSAGIISGLLRTITASGGGVSEQLEQLIQTDTAINPGNSGGPLLNLYGEVIGINTAIVKDAQSIGFAIPVNKVKKDISDIKKSGRIIYPMLGVRYVLVNKAIAESNKLSVDYGALISRGDNKDEPAIISGSAADKAGLKEGDIILELNGTKINEENPLSKLILQYSPGETINLKVLRDKKEIIISVVLDEMK
ncbi:MAG: trypsin-like peptidase domain-containing protein [bacterium]|nr:trypsin-like peptidase domain-containing protein [bacterium]